MKNDVDQIIFLIDPTTHTCFQCGYKFNMRIQNEIIIKCGIDTDTTFSYMKWCAICLYRNSVIYPLLIENGINIEKIYNYQVTIEYSHKLNKYVMIPLP